MTTLLTSPPAFSPLLLVLAFQPFQTMFHLYGYPHPIPSSRNQSCCSCTRRLHTIYRCQRDQSPVLACTWYVVPISRHPSTADEPWHWPKHSQCTGWPCRSGSCGSKIVLWLSLPYSTPPPPTFSRLLTSSASTLITPLYSLLTHLRLHN